MGFCKGALDFSVIYQELNNLMLLESADATQWRHLTPIRPTGKEGGVWGALTLIWLIVKYSKLKSHCRGLAATMAYNGAAGTIEKTFTIPN